MSNKALKIVITVLVVTTAFAALMYASLGESLQQYKYVDEVLAAPKQWEGKRLQVHGNVVPSSIERKPHTAEYRFDLQRNNKVMHAYFNFIPPDQFKDEAEVVLTGTLATDGTFHATSMTAKCPSKYEVQAPKGSQL
jgi:cytochrome c-type biogenesis protein CcmE